MPNNVPKYYPNRRAMPGQPLPSLNQRAVDERTFQLARDKEYTPHLQFSFTDTLDAGGRRGLHLNRLNAGDGTPFALMLEQQGLPVGGLESDGTNTYLSVSDSNGVAYHPLQLAYSGGVQMGFFGTAPQAQIAGATDVLAGLVTLGLRAASANPPLNLGSGSITAGSSTFNAPSLGRCLTLNSDAGATIFMNPKSGTSRMNIRWGSVYQFVSDLANNGTNDFGMQNLGSGNLVIYATATDLTTIGSNNALGGAILGASGGKAGFYGVAAPLVKQTISGSLNGNPALRSVCSTLGSLGLVTDNTTVNDPTIPAWTWVNQGGASVTTTNNAIFLNAPASVGDNLRARVIAVPTAPYTITISFIPMLTWADFLFCGLVLQDSVSGKLVTFNLSSAAATDSAGQTLGVAKWTNVTTVAGTYTTTPTLIKAPVWQAGPAMWMQVHDDATNRIWSISNDGVNWFQVLSTLRTDFITPDHIGFFVDVNNASYAGGINVLSWQQQ